MKLLLTAATSAEIQQTLDFLALQGELGIGNWELGDRTLRLGNWDIKVCITGVGLMAATFKLTKALLADKYDFVLQGGIAGTFEREAELGKVFAIGSETLGDLGAEDHDKFIDIFELGFEDRNKPPFTDGKLVNPLTNIPFKIDLPVVDSMTIHTVSGSAPTIAARRARHSVAMESMEGAALHYVCLQLDVPFLQVRATSNYITPRDRSSWQIGKAVGTLNRQLFEYLQLLSQA